MADKQIHIEVITPERQVLSCDAAGVVIPAHDGELGVLHDRAPLMCELGIGQLRYQQGGATQRLFIDGGFAQVHDNAVTVLTPRALARDEVTAETVSTAEAAVQAIAGHDPDAGVLREKAQQRVRVLRELQSTR